MGIGLFGPLELVILLGLSGFGLPLGIPPQPEDPLMARVAPRECVFYTTWAGTATPDPNSPNQTEQLLAEPEVQQLVAQLRRQIKAGLRQVTDREGPGAPAVLQDLSALAETLLTSPAALFLSSVEIGHTGPEISAGAVIRVGDDAQRLKASLLELHTKYLGPAAQPVEIAGDTWYRIQPPRGAPPITWGTKGKYLFLGAGEGSVEGILQRARSTAPPEWLTDVRRRLPVDRPATVTYINFRTVRKMLVPVIGGPRALAVVDAVGLGNVTSVASVTGLDEEGFTSKTLLGLDGEPQGLLASIAGAPLGPDDLGPIPRDATVAKAARFDADRLFEAILSVADKIEARREIDRRLGRIEEELDISLREDVLKPLGDVWCVYNSPGEGGLVITGLTLVVRLDDSQRLAATHEKVLKQLKAALDRSTGRRSPRVEQFEFAGEEVYFFNARDGDFPLAPAWCLTDDHLIVSTFPQQIKAYLSRGEDYESLAGEPRVARLLASDDRPGVVVYVDTRTLFELVYPLAQMVVQAATSGLAREGIDLNVSILPSAGAIGKHLRPSVVTVRQTEAGIELTSRQSLPGGDFSSTAPVAVALLLPAVSSARGAARRAQSSNNLKQVALALHNYHDTHRDFPAAYTTDENGKPLLSWRVQILPYVEQAALYERFHLDEPWDSEHNKKLIPLMPQTFKAPGSKTEPGKTNYLAVRGENTIFSGKDPIGIRDISDGTSVTIMTVEVNDGSAVVWTAPDDFQPDAANPFKGLVGLRRGGFQAGFGDGSVHFISQSIDPDILRALFTRNGGEVVRDF